jgi:uncharacterized protein
MLRQPIHRDTGVNRRRLLRAALAASAVSLATLSGGDERPLKQIPSVRIATGGIGGVYNAYGTALAECVRATSPSHSDWIRTRPSGGSVQNIRWLASGQADVAFSAADAAAQPLTATTPQPQNGPLRSLARLYDDFIHLTVARQSPVERIVDLRGLRVSIGANGSGTELIAERLLTAATLRPEADLVVSRLGVEDSASALRSRQVDAFFWSGGLPTDAVAVLANDLPIRLVDLSAEAATLRSQYGSAYRIGIIPAGTYLGQTDPIRTLAVPNLLITTATARSSLVYAVLQALFGYAPSIATTVPAAAQLNLEAAIYTDPIPLHEAARAYFRARKPYS